MNNQKERELTGRKCFLFFKTKSLNKLEKIIEKDPENKNKYVIAAYSYYKEEDSLNPIKHKNLIRLKNEFSEAIKQAKKNDPYYENYIIMQKVVNKRKDSLAFKKEAQKVLNLILEENNISIRSLSEETNIKYSNLYNFLRKDIYSDLSAMSVNKLLTRMIIFVKGKDRKETIKKTTDKFNKLLEY